MRFVPKLRCHGERIDPQVMPPGAFIAGVVKLAMMGTAERTSKLVADLAAKRFWLGEADVVRVGEKCAAEKTGLRDAPHKRGASSGAARRAHSVEPQF